MTPRSNLSDFIKERCIEAARAALGDGGEIEDAIAQRLVDDVLTTLQRSTCASRTPGRRNGRSSPRRSRVRARAARARSCAA